MANIRNLEKKMGEPCPVVKMSCGPPAATGKCVGNPWKRARTVPFKRTSDFELSASKIALNRWKREDRGDQHRGTITFGLTACSPRRVAEKYCHRER